MFKKLGRLLFILLFFCYQSSTHAQCAMCRAVLESEGNQSTAEGINDGIVYLMAVPYILVGVVFFCSVPHSSFTQKIGFSKTSTAFYKLRIIIFFILLILK